MSDLKTLAALLMCLPLSAQAVETTMVSAYASCAGRFSAELEHAWLMNSPEADAIASRRRHFIDLVNAAASPEDRRQALHLRISAKAAHAALLTQMTFSQDPARMRWAVQRARSEIAQCGGILPES